MRRLAVITLGRNREVDHQDRILFDDADQQDHADQRDDRKLASCDQQRQQCPYACRGQASNALTPAEGNVESNRIGMSS